MSIFIVGNGQSGTSILLRILGSHSKLYIVNMEYSDDCKIYKETNIFNNKRNMREITSKIEEWDRECVEAGKEQWIEKTPAHVYQVERILEFLPESRIIGIVRDGRDVVCSFQKMYNVKEVAKVAKRWVKSSKEMLRCSKFYKNNFMLVKYENLVVEQDALIKRVLHFLDLPYEYLLGYHNEKWIPHGKESNVTERYMRVDKPIFDGRGRWRDQMSQKDTDLFNSIAKKTMIELGYNA